ncbi:hypothetical protein [Gordonia insulae]|uniref:Uncharacterized protein n=1 Tax=Gordonia insulae TaxID=2420509 RepID=A0A3G8JQR0_9ACTN|nr:hypothetical protein [Gordonia insulae]AZG47451.1 hypothetical protein D7316_04061 [Gordonia insulae]
MTDDRTDGRENSSRTITSARPAYFLLARPTENADSLPATIGERDVFFDHDAAMDALDLHYAWCAAQRGGYHAAVVRTAHWYLQSAMVGPHVTPGLGEVYLAAADHDPLSPTAPRHLRSRAIAGAFLTEGELVHWTPFVRAATRYMPDAPDTDAFGLGYLGDDAIDFGQIWFAPLQSRRVYPERIVVGGDDA